MSETASEYRHGIYTSNRKQFLRDFTIKDLIDLIPNDDEFWSEFQEYLIDHIVEQNLDSQINGDVK